MRIFCLFQVCLGRYLLWKLTDNNKLNDLYTIIAGLYSIWFSIRLTTIAYHWVQMGIHQLFYKFKERISIVSDHTKNIIGFFYFNLFY